MTKVKVNVQSPIHPYIFLQCSNIQVVWTPDRTAQALSHLVTSPDLPPVHSSFLKAVCYSCKLSRHRLHSGRNSVKQTLPRPTELQAMGTCTGAWGRGYDIAVNSALLTQCQQCSSLKPRPHLISVVHHLLAWARQSWQNVFSESIASISFHHQAKCSDP